MRKQLAVAVLAAILPFNGQAQPKHHSTQPHSFSGLASWYGKWEQGHKMANGSRFDRNAFTAASRTLPLGTRIHVINPRNGRSVDVTVTDRGPGSPHRVLDLAEIAAQDIGCIQQGVCKVNVSVIKETKDE